MDTFEPYVIYELTPDLKYRRVYLGGHLLDEYRPSEHRRMKRLVGRLCDLRKKQIRKKILARFLEAT